MATYRVIPNSGRGWTATQDGSIGNEYKGSAGLYKIANAAVAGDKILIQGESLFASAPLVFDSVLFITAGTQDKTATWVVGDSLRNNTGSGNHWTGKLYSINATTMLISLDTGTYSTFTAAEGIENTTRSETSTCSSKAETTLYITANAGSAGGGMKSIITCDSSWNEKAGYCKLQTGYNNGLTLIYVPIDYVYLYGLIGYGGSTTFRQTGTNAITEKCYAENHGASTHTFWGCGGTASLIIDCIAIGTGAGENGFELSTQGTVSNCKAANCYYGFTIENYSVMMNCLAYNSTRNNILSNASTQVRIVGCILDKTGSSYAGIKITGTNMMQIIFNRITNSSTYGIESTALHSDIYENYNVFDSNTSGPRLNINAGPNSQTVSDTNQGYADANYATTRDYRLLITATGRRQTVNFNWDTTIGNLFYPSAGLPPTDITCPPTKVVFLKKTI